MPSKRRVTVEVVRYGQVRAYGPSETLARLTFEKEDEGRQFVPMPSGGAERLRYTREEIVKPTIKALVGNFYEDGDPQADWASPMLKSLKEIEPGVWEVLISSAYTD